MRGWEGGRDLVVAANRWSANRQKTLSTVLMWRGRERGGEGVREGDNAVKEVSSKAYTNFCVYLIYVCMYVCI